MFLEPSIKPSIMLIYILMFSLDGRDNKQLRYRGNNVQLLNKEMSEFLVTNHSIEMNVKKLFMGMNDLCYVLNL